MDRSHRTNNHDNVRVSARSIADNLFWIMLLQGVIFLLLGILVIMYPAVLFALAAASFIWAGVTVIVMAWRVRKFSKSEPAGAAEREAYA